MVGSYHPVSIQRDANLSTILLLELIAVDLDDSAVSNEEGVTYDPGFCAGVAFGVFIAVGCAAWCMEPFAVTQDR
jgi:hypothetical protein